MTTVLLASGAFPFTHHGKGGHKGCTVWYGVESIVESVETSPVTDRAGVLAYCIVTLS